MSALCIFQINMFFIIVIFIYLAGKVAVKNKNRSRQETNKNQNVFVSMDTVSSMIVKARRRRRPSTVYAIDQVNFDGMDAAAVRLQIMRQKNRNASDNNAFQKM